MIRTPFITRSVTISKPVVPGFGSTWLTAKICLPQTKQPLFTLNFPEPIISTALFRGSRPNMEDRLITAGDFQKRVYLYGVADGAGGHQGGEVASGLAEEIIKERFRQGYFFPEPAKTDFEELQDFFSWTLINTALEINEKLLSLKGQVPTPPADLGRTAQPMTTLCLALEYGNLLAVANVGDSRAYVIGKGATDAREAELITHDHSLVQALIDGRALTAQAAATSKQRSILLKSLGNIEGNDLSSAAPDIFFSFLEKDDLVLIASDGLTSALALESDHYCLEPIARIAASCGKNLTDALSAEAQRIAAEKNHSLDNVSIVVAMR